MEELKFGKEETNLFKLLNTLENENISVLQGNALDLSAFSSSQYDITLLLGPLYHLYSKEDKQQAVQEALRVAKQGGFIFAAYVISDGCLLDEGFKRSNINVAEYIKTGLLDAMDSETFELFLKYHFATCERSDLLGVTSHAADIFQKQ